MCHNQAARQNLAKRLTTALRKFEREGGSIQELAENCDTTERDLRRWAGGTTLPGEVFEALLGELPEHLASGLIGTTGRKLIDRDYSDQLCVLMAASKLSALSSEITERHADGVFCHRDRAAVSDHAARLIPELQGLIQEGED